MLSLVVKLVMTLILEGVEGQTSQKTFLLLMLGGVWFEVLNFSPCHIGY
jgi:hypothetical protein